jgi:hypothetical protein
MRTAAYVAVLGPFLAVLLVFATAPAMAQMSGSMTSHMSGPMMNNSGTTSPNQGQVTGKSQPQFTGQERAGASSEQKMESSQPGKAGATPQSRTGVTGQMKSSMEGQARGAMSASSKARTAATREGTARMRGGEATVASVDHPGNCLKIRSGPGISHKVIGCAKEGAKLHLNGAFSKDGRWAQLTNNGWVFFSQVRSDIRPPHAAASSRSFARPATAGRYHFRRGYYRRFHRYGFPYSYSYYYGPSYYGYSCPSYGYGYGYPGYYWY